MKKEMLYIIIVSLFIISCNSKDKVKIEGEFVKVQSKKFDVYTFNFNDMLTINDNGDNFLITDGNGNKSIGTIENGIISLNNNCKILIDNTENVLIKTCQNNNSSISSDYWPKEKIAEYFSDLNNINFHNYINGNLSKNLQNDAYLAFFGEGDIPLPESQKKYINKELQKNNPFYPYMCFGDFNGDKIYPDIATIIGNAEAGFDKDYFGLIVLHAGAKHEVHIRSEFYPWLSSGHNFKEWIMSPNEEKQKNTFYSKDNDNNNMTGFEWNGYKYKPNYINMH